MLESVASTGGRLMIELMSRCDSMKAICAARGSRCRGKRLMMDACCVSIVSGKVRLRKKVQTSFVLQTARSKQPPLDIAQDG